MHCRLVIVSVARILPEVGRHFEELGPVLRFDIVPVNGDILVSIGPSLLVHVAQRVKPLVLDGFGIETARGRQIDLLLIICLVHYCVVFSC